MYLRLKFVGLNYNEKNIIYVDIQCTILNTYISLNDYGKLLNSDECRVNYSWSAHNTVRTYIRILLSSECKT